MRGGRASAHACNPALTCEPGSHSGALMTGMAPSDWTALLVMGCRDTVADDGFVYNVCALALERALFHRMGLVRILMAKTEHAMAAGREDTIGDMMRSTLACHIEVLMRAAHHQESE